LKLVLDTNVYCDYAEGLSDVVDAIATFGQYIFIPAVVIGELDYGFRKGARKAFNERKLKQMITRLQIEIIDVNMSVARKYAIIYLSLSRKGKKVPINDVWIAACTMELGGTLLTRDKHFSAVDQIETMIL
jgi:predicted nucleic acid-binding protein